MVTCADIDNLSSKCVKENENKREERHTETETGKGKYTFL